MKSALIAGITGQDGAYLAQHLLRSGYRVCGLTSSARPLNRRNLEYLGILDRLIFRDVDLCSVENVRAAIQAVEPDEIYGLAAQSLVWASWEMGPLTLRFNIDSVNALLEAAQSSGVPSRIFIALSSEVFGRPDILPITEATPFHPSTPYGISKATAYWLSRAYRERYGLFVATGFLFNHESVLRPEIFLVKKIIRTALDIEAGTASELVLGNIDIRRDFGYAPEYVQAMQAILSVSAADDYVIATGEPMSIRQIVEQVFLSLNLPMSHLRIDSRLLRLNDVAESYGCPERAARILGWQPQTKGASLVARLLNDHRHLRIGAGAKVA